MSLFFGVGEFVKVCGDLLTCALKHSKDDLRRFVCVGRYSVWIVGLN